MEHHKEEKFFKVQRAEVPSSCSLFDFLKNKEYCDVSLRSSDGKFISCHQVVLASNCFYFHVSWNLKGNFLQVISSNFLSTLGNLQVKSLWREACLNFQ